jgi:hypothetical protein
MYFQPTGKALEKDSFGEAAVQVRVARAQNHQPLRGRQRGARPHKDVLRDDSQGRDSPIVKHYSFIKNPCFVSCVNYALCSFGKNYS